VWGGDSDGVWTEHFMENIEEKLEEFRKSGHKVVYDREVR